MSTSQLYRNPNGTIARRSDGRIMRAPTQQEFEDCCCDSKCVRGDCTFDADSTITGYSRHVWEYLYSDTNCQTPHDWGWETPPPDKKEVVTSFGPLEPLWTNDDLTNCGVWGGRASCAVTWSGGESPPIVMPILLYLRYTDSNEWEYWDNSPNQEPAWRPIYNSVDWPDASDPDGEYLTIHQSDCEGYSHTYDSGCQTIGSSSQHWGHNCSFTVQNNPLP